jgi:hypothetical protein
MERKKSTFLCRGNMRVTEVGWFDSQYEQTMPNTAAHLRIYAVFAIYASQIQSPCIFLSATSSLLSNLIQLGSLSPNSQSHMCSVAT